METVLDRLTTPAVAIPLLVFSLYTLYTYLTSEPLIPAELPWIGKRSNKLFAETRAHFASFHNVRNWLAEGYEKYSKKGKAYVFPDFSGKPEVIIPRSEMTWLLEHADNVLSVSEFHNDILEGRYGFTDAHLLKDPYHEHVIHRNLARRLGPIVPEIWDELQHAMDETWGVDTENWKDICIFENMMHVIARASNRMFLGLPLCRNEEYLRNMGYFAQDVITTMVCLRFTPRILKPVIGPLFALPNSYHYRKTAKYTLPLIEERLDNMVKKDADPSYPWEAPNDYITWHIQQARAERKTRELSPTMIARRLMPLNFAAIHTTVFTATNALLDLLASPPSAGCIPQLCEEVERVYAEEGHAWSKAALARLVRADSALRESLRVSNFMTRGLLRKVVAAGGVRNEREGWRLPRGAYVGVDVHSVMHDPEIYDRPETYDALRFSRPREAFLARVVEERRMDEALRLNSTGLITTSDTFLPFGHGRHACPGRFFVAHELKMLIAYMLLNYDVQPLAVRPPNTWFGQNVIPPTKACIKVKRRPGTVRDGAKA